MGINLISREYRKQLIVAKPETRQREIRAELGKVLRNSSRRRSEGLSLESRRFRNNSKGLSARAETRTASCKETSKDESKDKESEAARAESRKGLNKNSKVRIETR